MRTLSRSLILLFLALSCFAVACGDGEDNNGSSSVTNPFAGDAAAAAKGKTEYEKTCTACHGVDGSPGAVSMKDLRQTAKNDSDGEIFNYIHDGVEGTSMVAYGGMYTDDQIWELVTHIRTFAN